MGLAALLALLVAAGPAGAGETWLHVTKTVAGQGLVEIGAGRFPASESAVKADRIEKALVRLGRNDVGTLGNPRADGKRTLLDLSYSGIGIAAVAVQLRPLSITLGAKEFEAYLKEIGAEHAIAYRKEKGESNATGRESALELPKTFLEMGASPVRFVPPLGLPLELVTDADPFSLAPGRSFVLTLFRDGRAHPRQLVRVLGADGKTLFARRTDPNGQVEIPLESPGRLLVVTTSIERLPAGADADWRSLRASLALEIAGKGK